MIQGLHTIWCQTSDMERSVAFYRDVLGLKPGYVSEHWSEFDLGNGKLALHHQLEGAQSPLGSYLKGWVVGIQTDDVVGLRSKLESLGVKLHGGLHDIPTGVIFDFEDPDGNVLEAVQPGVTTQDLV